MPTGQAGHLYKQKLEFDNMNNNEDQIRIEAIGEQLRAKISSKFQTSTFLAGLSFAVISLQLSILWQGNQIPILLQFSIPIMLTAVMLYVVAIIKLDGLTMPKRFWKEAATENDLTVSRHGYLQDEDLWELRKRMIFYWTNFTIIAIYLTILATLLMIVPLQKVDFSLVIVQKTFFNLCISTIILIVYFAILYFRSRRLFKPLLRPFD